MVPNSNEKLHYKGERYRFSVQLVALVQTESRHPVSFVLKISGIGQYF